MRNTITWILITLISIPLLPEALEAQQPVQVEGRQKIDGIAAVVGEEIILKSDVELQFQYEVGMRRLTANTLTPELEADIREAVLERLIDQAVIVERAKRDSIVVTRNEIETAIDQWLDTIRANVGGESALQQQLEAEGITLQELRDRRKIMAENELLQAKMIQSLGIRPTAVSRKEGEAFIRENGEGLLILRHIFLTKPPPGELDAATRARAEQLRDRILNGGEDFAVVAREYSDDTSSGQAGGDLGTAPRGTYVTSVDSTVWDIPVGEVSEPVKSQYGWHLVQVISRGDEGAHARHILIRPNAEQAMADTILHIENALNTGEDFGDLVARFSDEEDATERKGYFQLLPKDIQPGAASLPYEWIQALQSLEVEDWAGPLESQDGIHFIQRLPVDDAAVNLVLQYNFPVVEFSIQRGREQEELERWVRELRAETYVEIKPY